MSVTDHEALRYVIFSGLLFFLRYGRTAAMRLIVQPYDEDDDYYYFLSFS
jgi:hypothetical protein